MPICLLVGSSLDTMNTNPINADLYVCLLFSNQINAETLRPIYGLIFLFKWKGEAEEQGKVLFGDTEVFFAKQVKT